MDGYPLPPDLEEFAAEAIASGRFRDVNEVVRAGLDMVRRREAARSAFIETLEEAEAEADRDGTFTIEQVAAELDDIIAEADRRHA